MNCTLTWTVISTVYFLSDRTWGIYLWCAGSNASDVLSENTLYLHPQPWHWYPQVWFPHLFNGLFSPHQPTCLQWYPCFSVLGIGIWNIISLLKCKLSFRNPIFLFSSLYFCHVAVLGKEKKQPSITLKTLSNYFCGQAWEFSLIVTLPECLVGPVILTYNWWHIPFAL